MCVFIVSGAIFALNVCRRLVLETSLCPLTTPTIYSVIKYVCLFYFCSAIFFLSICRLAEDGEKKVTHCTSFSPLCSLISVPHSFCVSLSVHFSHKLTSLWWQAREKKKRVYETIFAFFSIHFNNSLVCLNVIDRFFFLYLFVHTWRTRKWAARVFIWMTILILFPPKNKNQQFN